MSNNHNVKNFFQNSINQKNIFESHNFKDTPSIDFEKNIFSNIHFESIAHEESGAENAIKAEKHRLNGTDADILNGGVQKNAPKSNFIYKIIPSFRKTKAVKDALKNIKYLNKLANELNKKQIPFGEQDERYKNLVDYLTQVNEIQIKIDGKK